MPVFVTKICCPQLEILEVLENYPKLTYPFAIIIFFFCPIIAIKNQITIGIAETWRCACRVLSH